MRDTSFTMSIALRPSEALRLLHGTALAQVRDGDPGLTLSQTAILLAAFLQAPPRTARSLADRRNVLVRRTGRGSLHVSRMADRVVAEAGELKP